MEIRQIDTQEAQAKLPDLIALLKNVVDDGASIGFILPLSETEAQGYWQKRIQAVAAGEALLYIVEAEGQLVGTGQLALETRANGRHRAEVQKVLCHSAFRRRGIGRLIMQALEAAARERQLRLLFLDTRRGDPSEQLYQSLGYQITGIIPEYVINERGEYEDTVVYHKLLSS